MYVLKCTDNGEHTGKYVAKSGHISSYTSNINYVRKFDSVDSANIHKCGNEIVVSIKDV